MTSVPLWFQRKFEFSFPVEVYPNVRVRLQGTPARLEEMLRDYPRELLIRKPVDQWSIQEHAGHLLDLEPLWTERIEDFVSGRPELTAADLTNRKTHAAGHNSKPLGEILAQFRRVRSGLLNRADDAGPLRIARTLPHPRMRTPMRLIDHLYFVAEHDDHHLARMWELMREK
jgi:uncharacterized damage-inducible protein DinB